jgi:hypothetical protein
MFGMAGRRRKGPKVKAKAPPEVILHRADDPLDYLIPAGRLLIYVAVPANVFPAFYFLAHKRKGLLAVQALFFMAFLMAHTYLHKRRGLSPDRRNPRPFEISLQRGIFVSQASIYASIGLTVYSTGFFDPVINLLVRWGVGAALARILSFLSSSLAAGIVGNTGYAIVRKWVTSRSAPGK